MNWVPRLKCHVIRLSDLTAHIVRSASVPVASSKGAKPADLPVVQASKFELPPTLLALGDDTTGFEIGYQLRGIEGNQTSSQS